MIHGNLYGIIAVGNGRLSQTVAFTAHQDRQLFLCHETGIINGDGIVTEGHGCGFEAQVFQLLHTFFRPAAGKGPGDLKYSTHTDTGAAAVQGIGAAGSQQHRIHTEGSGGAEDSTHIGGVLNIFQDHDPFRVPADLFYRSQFGTAHGAKHAPGQMVTGEFAQQIFVSGENRDLRAAGKDLCGTAVDILALHQHGNRLATGIQCPVNNLRAFGNKHTFCRFKSVQKLRFRQPGIDIQFRCGKISDFNNIGHKHFPCNKYKSILYLIKIQDKSQRILKILTFS